ncbi:DUF58 domain-containing protein [Paramylibacter kogurei]|uniref:DUF58 domain-containing protein n=1 Tax=Paramylibacter kogurei TaxID=1889778 RepID=UPI002694632E
MNDEPIITPAQLRADAGQLAAGFPALLARAQHLVASLNIGSHGRKRAGVGDEFWQYRPAISGDSRSAIDWRRSARTDAQFIRQMEWQSAQTVHFWVDSGASMDFSSDVNLETKSSRATVLALALAILLSRAGERVGLLSDPRPAKSGESQIQKIAQTLANIGDKDDYAYPPQKALPNGSRAILISDFMGEWEPLVQAISKTADQNVSGCLVQVLDPSELSFPFKGRVIFESMKSSLNFETLRANSLRDEYIQKLAERQDALRSLARKSGWRYYTHNTDSAVQSAFLWLYNATEQGAAR